MSKAKRQQPTAADIGHWVTTAERGDTFCYGYHGINEYPNSSAMHAAMKLYDLGLVALVQRREPDGRMAYIMQRTWGKRE